MKIAVIGPGAIGSLVAGYLKLNNEDVSLVGRADSVKAVINNGLTISGVRGSFNIKIPASEKLDYAPDLIILSTKTQDLEEALKNNISFIRRALILTTQNGVQADNIISRYVEKASIVSSIVMFGATLLEPAKVVHNFEGSLIIGKLFGKNDESVTQLRELLSKAFVTEVSDELLGMKYLKVFVNSNNCIPAILGQSMQEAFSDMQISKLSIAIWKEGLDIVNRRGIKLVSLPDFPLERIAKLTAMPAAEAAKILSGIMTNLSKEPLYGSILQSIKRNRPSEIDYINGEFVRLAQEGGFVAPLNKRLTDMVHRVEQTKSFFSKEDLLNSTKEFLN